jgi:protoporphyrinogen oxidase
MQTSKHQKIAVVGAGPMGLAVAYQLVKAGYRPIVFEANDTVGGMAASFEFDGLRIERFYHFHCTSDKAFLNMLTELGIESRMHWAETKMGYYYRGRVQAWGDPIALLKFSGLSWMSKVRYGAHVLMSTRRNKWHSLDNLESTAWLKHWVGKEAYELLWRKLFDLKFYHYSQNISAAWTWSRLRRVGRSRYNIFREKLGYLEGGSDTLLNALKVYIETHGGEIRLACAIKKVVIEDGTVKGVETHTGFEEFSKVICTIPTPYLPEIINDLPKSLLDAYQRIQNIAIVCVIAKLRKPVSPYFWLNTNDPDLDIPGLIEYTKLRPLNEHIVYVPYYMPTEQPKFLQPNEAFMAETKKYIQRINPDIEDEDFISMEASRYRYAQPIYKPGFLKSLPPVNLPINGLWAADSSYYYPEDRGISESIHFGRQMALLAIKSSDEFDSPRPN